MSKNKKDQNEVNENTNAQLENGNEKNGGDISPVKFNQIFIAIGICVLLMVIAKLLGL